MLNWIRRVYELSRGPCRRVITYAVNGRWSKAVLIAACIVLLVVLGLPILMKQYVVHVVVPKFESKYGATVSIGNVSVGLRRVSFSSLTFRWVRNGAFSIAGDVANVTVSLSLSSLFTGQVSAKSVELTRPRVKANIDIDGIKALKRGHSRGNKKADSNRQRPAITVIDGVFRVAVPKWRVSVKWERMQSTAFQGQPSLMSAKRVIINHPLLPEPIFFATLDVKQRTGESSRDIVAEVSGGRLHALPRLILSAISGSAKFSTAKNKIDLALQGSYGGATASLWRADGFLNTETQNGRVDVVADRFQLSRIASLLKFSPVIHPEKASVDARMRFEISRGEVQFHGSLDMKDLNVFHPSLARSPLMDLNLEVSVNGATDGKILTFDLPSIRSRGVEAKASGRIDTSGADKQVKVLAEVLPVECQMMFDAIPPALTHRLAGAQLEGTFKASLNLDIDYGNLDELVFDGDAGIDDCTVTHLPQAVEPDILTHDFEHTVEPIPNEAMTFIVGAENSDFVPLEAVSPHVVNVFLTTEDASFFRHRGFIPSQFRKALARNLKQGGFRLGASTISMQLVKNVFLSHEKTLARKLQELILVWHVEQQLSKRRLLEIYLNVIEFGPRIYGIGAASRHFFGKHASQLGPLEAAYFASILPSPLRRYAHYCRGKLSDHWRRYLMRIVSRMHSRGYLSDEDVEAAKLQSIVFHRSEHAENSVQCLKRVEDMRQDWQDAYRTRLREAIMRAAPHQVDHYLKEQ